jgi:hypothetical protein
MRLVAAFACAVMLICLGVPRGHADEKRVALVIGNGDYQRADKLANPVTDARRLREALTKLRFEIVYGENLNKQALEGAIGGFADAAQEADVALVFFAGLGLWRPALRQRRDAPAKGLGDPSFEACAANRPSAIRRRSQGFDEVSIERSAKVIKEGLAQAERGEFVPDEVVAVMSAALSRSVTGCRHSRGGGRNVTTYCPDCGRSGLSAAPRSPSWSPTTAC